MASYDELVAHERSMREILERGVADELRAIPGVVHVSVGLRERQGKVQQESVIRVYVRKKKPLNDIAAAERIPAKIGGFATDVIGRGTKYEFGDDTTRYRPILGGISITNGNISDINPEMKARHGTLCCFGTLNGDNTPVLLTCAHVLETEYGEKGQRVFQPDAVQPALDGQDLPWVPRDSTNAIGRIVDFKYTADADAGIASVDVSSCCRCCGIDFKNSVNGISQPVAPGSEVKKPPTDDIVGERVAVKNMKVYKVGQRTGRTEGTVVDDNGPSEAIAARGTIGAHTFSGYMLIASSDPTKPFSARGDSGSAVIDEDGYIVGMIFAQNTDAPPLSRTLACHIKKVRETVDITLSFAPAQTTAGVAQPPRQILRPSDSDVALYEAARNRLLQHPAAAALYEIAERHRVEVVRLVTEHRPVTVAWHRTHGPAFFARALNAIRDGRDTLPAAIDGTSFYTALERMGDVLSAHGSDELRAAIATHGPALLAAVQGSSTMPEILRRLACDYVEVST